MDKLIYIASEGHSGSTVLGSLLGNNKKSYHAGELSNFYKVYNGNLETCSCNKPPTECDFWSQVILDLKNVLATYNLTLEDYEKLRKNIELNIFKDKYSKDDFNLYKKTTQHFFEIISQTSGKPILIDSSKSPKRGLALKKVFGQKIVIIYLIKDLRSVTQSFQRKRGRFPVIPFLKSTIKSHFKFVLMLRKAKNNYAIFSYNEMFSQENFNKLIQKTGIKESVNINEPINNQHIIAGNRLRYQNKFFLEKPPEKKYNFSRFEVLCIQIADKLRLIH